MLNDQSMLDVRKIVTGKDGQLFVTGSSGNQIFLAETATFKAQLAFTDTDYQPIGSALRFKINTGFSITLTLTETVIRDDVMLQELIADLQNGFVPSYDFQGKVTRHSDGQFQRQVYRYCMPTGNVDLMNIAPGQILQRDWSFAVNATPELLDSFKTA